MGPVNGIKASSADLARASHERAVAPVPSARALIPLQPVGRADTPAHDRPRAGFLAHLIATDRQLPQTRERRRAEPAEAVAAYRAVNAGLPAPAGKTLSRTM